VGGSVVAKHKQAGGETDNNTNSKQGTPMSKVAEKEDATKVAQKTLEKINDMKVTINKVKAFITNDVQTKYVNYHKTFTAITANANPDLDVLITGDTINDPFSVEGKYKTLFDTSDDKSKWLEDIKKKFGENRTILEKTRDELIAISEMNEIKNLPVKTSFKNQIKNAFDGDFSGNQGESVESQVGLLSQYELILKNIQAKFEEVKTILKPIATKIIEVKAQQVKLTERKSAYGVFGPPLPGQPPGRVGGDPQNTSRHGGGESVDNIITNFDKKYKALIEVLQKLESEFKKQSSPAFASASGEPSMFTTIFNKFQNDKFNDGPIVAAQKLGESLKYNKLLPTDVLKIRSTDRWVFVCITIFIRMLVIQLTEYFIGTGRINNISTALIVFVVLYSFVFIAFVLYVNFDLYRLRIIFNYVNLHGNTAVIMMHLGILYIMTYAIFMIIWNINFPVKGLKTIAISEEDKAYLMYQLEMITMIVWVFILLLVLLV
jgi:hypothetical protein